MSSSASRDSYTHSAHPPRIPQSCLSFRLGQEKVTYALEGSVACAGRVAAGSKEIGGAGQGVRALSKKEV